VFEGGSVSYAYTTIPTYPSGQIGMIVCCKGRQLDMRQPRQPPPGPHEQLGIGPLM
jgi:spermidine synthase